jgi:hypothetical protein
MGGAVGTVLATAYVLMVRTADPTVCGVNVTRIMSRDELGGLQNRAADGGEMPAPEGFGGGGTAQALGGGSGCVDASAQQYTGTRFEYARNGQALTHALGETWCWDQGSPLSAPTEYAVTCARQDEGPSRRVRPDRDVALQHVVLL